MFGNPRTITCAMIFFSAITAELITCANAYKRLKSPNLSAAAVVGGVPFALLESYDSAGGRQGVVAAANCKPVLTRSVGFRSVGPSAGAAPCKKAARLAGIEHHHPRWLCHGFPAARADPYLRGSVVCTGDPDFDQQQQGCAHVRGAACARCAEMRQSVSRAAPSLRLLWDRPRDHREQLHL